MAENKSKRDEEIDLREYFRVIAINKKLAAGITVGIVVIALIVSLILPPIYRAETKVLPPQQSASSMTAQMMYQLGGLAGLVPGALGVKTPADTYIAMLKSRTVFDQIIDRFGLMKLYDVKFREDARKKLEELVVARSGKDGIIIVTIEDKDPNRAADMANALVEELKRLSKGMAVTEAAQRRLFFEEQLADVKVSLAKAEEGMKGFQETTGALKIDDQAKVVIAGIASLRAQISAKEVQQKVLKTYVTPQNPDLQRVEEEIRGLQAELHKLESKSSRSFDPLMSTGRMPSVGMEYIRKLRDFKYNEALYEQLAKQYELARLDEARDAVVFQVIDKAIPPEKKVKPKRAQIVIIATLLGYLLSMVIILVREHWRKTYKKTTQP